MAPLERALKIERTQISNAYVEGIAELRKEEICVLCSALGLFRIRAGCSRRPSPRRAAPEAPFPEVFFRGKDPPEMEIRGNGKSGGVFSEDQPHLRPGRQPYLRKRSSRNAEIPVAN